MKSIERLAARLLVVAPTLRVLMLRLDPSFRDAFWVTPGGGVDEGESFEDAARRELYEEVGRADLDLGRCVAEGDVEFPWEDWLVRQHERTFLVLAPLEFDPVVVEAGEEPIVATGWFSVTELRACPEPVYPDGLADVLTSVVSSRGVFHGREGAS